MSGTEKWALRIGALLLCVLAVLMRDWGGEGFFDWGNLIAAIPFVLAIIIFNRTRARN